MLKFVSIINIVQNDSLSLMVDNSNTSQSMSSSIKIIKEAEVLNLYSYFSLQCMLLNHHLYYHYMSMKVQQQLYIAKIAEQSQRFQDMLTAMSKVVLANADLTIEQRNLLSIACTNIVHPKLTALRTLSSIQTKEQRGSREWQLLRSYKAKVEDELIRQSHQIINLCDSYLIPQSANEQKSIFYYKMKGNYCRYICEYTNGTQSFGAQISFKAAIEKAQQVMRVTDPIRLGLILNYSAFLYQCKKDLKKAYQLSKAAFEEVLVHMGQIEEHEKRDVETIIQLLRDNVTLWELEIEQNYEQ